MNADPSPWRTVKETAARVGCGVKLVYREIKAGRLRAARLGGRSGAIRVHVDWIDQWLNESTRWVEVGRTR